MFKLKSVLNLQVNDVFMVNFGSYKATIWKESNDNFVVVAAGLNSDGVSTASLSFDHHILDGIETVAFNGTATTFEQAQIIYVDTQTQFNSLCMAGIMSQEEHHALHY